MEARYAECFICGRKNVECDVYGFPDPDDEFLDEPVCDDCKSITRNIIKQLVQAQLETKRE